MLTNEINKVYTSRVISKGNSEKEMLKECYVANLLNDNPGFFENKFSSNITNPLERTRFVYESIFSTFQGMFNYVSSHDNCRILSPEQPKEFMPEFRLKWITYRQSENGETIIDYTEKGLEIMNGYFRLIGEESVQERRDSEKEMIASGAKGKNLSHLFN